MLKGLNLIELGAQVTLLKEGPIPDHATRDTLKHCGTGGQLSHREFYQDGSRNGSFEAEVSS